ncbi:MAG: hypothetical protein M3T49_03575 [Candidatus Eremiobacteraeota bacterium]|nr:hypothetical protein [Candidatus Eremiobacteraeota bacterium]
MSYDSGVFGLIGDSFPKNPNAYIPDEHDDGQHVDQLQYQVDHRYAIVGPPPDSYSDRWHGRSFLCPIDLDTRF